MTGHWLTLSEAARRISEATGRKCSLDEVIALGDDDGPLQAQFMHGYWSVSEESVTAYLSAPECPGRDADEVAEHADRTEWRGGPDLPDFIEDEYQRGKDT
ncbi:hypothetical protein [Nonomuraea sp. NPDC050202]|uniref:hypothetical protein n=1 Tax=Nonomuraea sp. NPDC050202 TaxID=3155035 RepID=UPI0033D014B9